MSSPQRFSHQKFERRDWLAKVVRESNDRDALGEDKRSQLVGKAIVEVATMVVAIARDRKTRRASVGETLYRKLATVGHLAADAVAGKAHATRPPAGNPRMPIESPTIYRTFSLEWL